MTQKNKKRYNLACINLMVSKARKIKQAIGITDYFNEQDKKDIMGWAFKDAKKVWLDTCNYDLLGGLSMNECPFCRYYHKNCFRCSYGKQHGVCQGYNKDKKNVWGDIIAAFAKQGLYELEVFNHPFYVKGIKRINKKYGIII